MYNRVKGVVAVGACGAACGFYLAAQACAFSHTVRCQWSRRCDASSSQGAAVEVEMGHRVHVDRVLLVVAVAAAGGRFVGGWQQGWGGQIRWAPVSPNPSAGESGGWANRPCEQEDVSIGKLIPWPQYWS